MTISKVLVANRGEIARRVFRTCHVMGIATVAVYSDADVNAPHVQEAGEAYRLPGLSPSDTYLNVDALLSAATSAGADAIHPGYGFLSESSRFARAVCEAGFVWIGPPPDAIEIMGSKIRSKGLIESLGLPVLPSIELDAKSQLVGEEENISYPILVKASAGGGGKGMRIVRQPEDLDNAIETARREAAAAFGDDKVFLEKYLESPRHIEIQVFGDQEGNVISLFERECSIQRRHQKIIEESPSPAIDDVTRTEMGEAAVLAAKAVNYVGAGTVEFLFSEDQYFFLEMNTRLQVEHPVTEMVTGLDLVRLQIEVADGGTVDSIEPQIQGHAIEARVYAEDPLNEFLPVTGMFHQFSFPALTGLRVDSGIEAGSQVSVHYDPMLAKVIAHAPTRREATETLARALRRAHIHGSTTNRALLVRILEDEEFANGQFDTAFLDRRDLSALAAQLADKQTELLAAVAAALSDQAAERLTTPVLQTIPSGWRNLPSQLRHRAYQGSADPIDIRYSTDSAFHVDGLGKCRVMTAGPNDVAFEVDGAEYQFEVARYEDERYVDSLSVPVTLTAVPRFPLPEREDSIGSLLSPMPGKVIRVDVEVGDEVDHGKILVVLEAMKMEHTLRSPRQGVVTEIRHRPGDQVEADSVLIVVDA
ncbi:MAG: biotin carboxylase N-terminal domain-containing protein [Acidimicrobiia bacterium]